jgi:hypothetical protein
MELSWPTKLKITAVITLGVIVIGILAWPLVKPADPLSPVRVTNINASGVITLIILAFVLGFAGYFIGWPHGREIGVLAAPSGLVVWAIRSQNIAGSFQVNPTIGQRQILLSGLRWESLFWLIIIAAGFAGVIAAQHFRPIGETEKSPNDSKRILDRYISAIIAIAASSAIVYLALRVSACDVSPSENSAVAQPPTGQIAFAVLVSFGLAAFVLKKFLNLSYIWSLPASAIVIVLSASIYFREKVLTHFISSYPANFFPDVIISILPVQMVAFGTLGAIIGYWLAFRYDYWRQYENSQ